MTRHVVSGLLLLWFSMPTTAFSQQADERWKSALALAQAEDNNREYAKAEQTFGQALHEALRFGPDDARVATTLAGQGMNYLRQRKFTEAEAAFRHALAIVENTSEEDGPEIADATLNLAKALVEGGHQTTAVPLIRKALGIYQTTYGGFHEKTAAALCVLGDAFRLSRSYAEAESPLRQCADIRENNGGVQGAEFAEALHSLALDYMSEGKLALAEPRFTLAEKIQEKALGITSPELARTMEDHVVVLRKLGRDQEAGRLATMAAAIRRATK